MPVYGHLATMGLTDLLQWVGISQQTGVLELERRGMTKRIEFRKGFITSCWSNDRPNQLGQYMLARGKVTEAQLEQAFELQQQSGKRLGRLLQEMGVLSEQELARFIASSIEDTMQVLFDWKDAAFSFYRGATVDAQQVDVNLAVHDVLLRGIQFQDELKRFRGVFESSGAVLRRTDRPVPDELSRGISSVIFESIDGTRTILEVLRTSRASEQLVLKLLFRLHQMGLVEVVEVRPIEAVGQTLLDPAPADAPDDDVAIADGTSTAGLALADDLSVEAEAARRLMRRGESGAAVELLNAAFRANPGHYDLGCQLAQAEAAFVTGSTASTLSPTAIPVARSTTDGDDPDLEAEVRFLLHLIDGHFDVASLLSLATLREDEVLRTLERMLDRGLIELSQPDPHETTPQPSAS